MAQDTHTFRKELMAPDGQEIEVEIRYKIQPPDRRAGVTWHWPEVDEVRFAVAGGTIGKLPETWYEKMEDAIYQAAEEHMQNLPTEADWI